ncbi:hypothetical protein EVG20_g749 [Dentipellis fragilis]|uniref:Uncharacterized protein n=1 Tax=Dentipellis fragilis TaxID=205917 RepID=A0A4Y9ZBN1_9AGAM|nr:hypothetical protein EVG20_g749 [Dentipellis fragilis]
MNEGNFTPDSDSEQQRQPTWMDFDFESMLELLNSFPVNDGELGAQATDIASGGTQGMPAMQPEGDGYGVVGGGSDMMGANMPQQVYALVPRMPYPSTLSARPPSHGMYRTLPTPMAGVSRVPTPAPAPTPTPPARQNPLVTTSAAYNHGIEGPAQANAKLYAYIKEALPQLLNETKDARSEAEAAKAEAAAARAEAAAARNVAARLESRLEQQESSVGPQRVHRQHPNRAPRNTDIEDLTHRKVASALGIAYKGRSKKLDLPDIVPEDNLVEPPDNQLGPWMYNWTKPITFPYNYRCCERIVKFLKSDKEHVSENDRVFLLLPNDRQWYSVSRYLETLSKQYREKIDHEKQVKATDRRVGLTRRRRRKEMAKKMHAAAPDVEKQIAEALGIAPD